VSLTIGGRAVALVSLYDPELDLLDVRTIAPAHHVLRLFFFARTPDGMAAGDEIELTDRLWAGAPTLAVSRATGSGGVGVASNTRVQSAASPAASAGVVSRARVLAMPERPSAGGRPVEGGLAAPGVVAGGAGVLLIGLGWVCGWTLRRAWRRREIGDAKVE
jgi:hypothetical protein